jgi:uncharacterized protein DUF4112
MSRINRKVIVPERSNILSDDPESRAKRVRALAKLLDNAITVPGTRWKIGFDPIVGLIPGIGDLIAAVLSGYIILEAARAEVSSITLARMLVNVGIDTLVGAIPALGDVFDAAWKSNTRNVALLERHLASEKAVGVRKRRSVGTTMVLAILVLVLILGAGLALGIFVARLLWNLGTR